ncbi:MAG: RIP metalloprotease RseP [Sphaerochaeta sp.]|nr:RIP metalloprotease RseP [Sphaerochaeta sp.]
MNSLLTLISKYLIGLLGIGLVVVIHELGHLWAAKACNIDVEVFSFGLGPKLWGIEHKGTDFRISILPFGGYCRLKGSDDLSQALLQKDKDFTHIEQGSLFSVHPAKRIVTYLCGPLLNLVFAILLYSVLAAIPYKVLSTEPVIATINDYPTLFSQATSPAYEQGLLTGDKVLELNGTKIRDWEELERLLADSAGIQLFTVERSGEVFTLPIEGENTGQGIRYGISVIREPLVGSVRPSTPEDDAGLKKGDRILRANGIRITNDLALLAALEADTESSDLLVLRGSQEISVSFRPDLNAQGKGEWNFALASENRSIKAPTFSLLKGWETTARMTKDTLSSLILLIGGKSQDVRQEFTGAARAALMIGDITALGLENDTASGFRALWYLLGVVSISLGIANLLPLPAFDGGQVLTSLFEWITGRHIQPRTYWILQLVGIVTVFCIFVFLGFADMLHFLSIRR